MRRVLQLIQLALCLAAFAGIAQAQPSLGGAHVQAVLAAETDGAAPGSTLYVAVVQKIDKGWHTYWRNPGDAGEATKLTWTLPTGWAAGDIVWPAPRRLPVGPLMNYGFEDQAVLAVPIQVPADAKPGTTAHLAAKVAMLVCADVCVPQDADVALDVPVTAGAAPVDPTWGAVIAKALAQAPKDSGLTATWQLAGETLKIAVAGPALAGHGGADAYFYPYDDSVIDQAKPETVDLGAQGLTFAATAGAAFKQSPAPTQVSGVIETADGQAFVVNATSGAPPPQSGGLGAPSQTAEMGLGAAVLFAFAGGLILNLMPCVFPILSMKAASLIARPHEAGAARAQGLAFLVGVVGTFLALAGSIIALRGAGQAVGWGSQLQPAIVTAGLALVMLAAALDMSGVFEVGASLQGLGGGLASRAGLVGGVFTGALAVVVAAPCTAPFMGPALGYALTQPAPQALLVFLGLALGFAAPFTLLAFTPGLLKLLPKPGPWMDVLKKALAFPMYGAAAWLLWVLAAQTDRGSLAAAFAGAVLVGLAAWIFGAAQRRSANGQHARVVFGLSGAAVAAAVAVLVLAPFGPAPDAANASVAVAAGIPSEPWSPERVAALRAEGKPVFVDFTAAWCVTCQFNEQVALNTKEAVAAFQRTGAVYLKADWTNRDNAIAKALADQGRVGVPLYLVYGTDGGPPKVLPQLLTSGLVAAALDAAKPPAAAAR
ncbi:MAG TPA: thioredoxin family protein [Caulobacteraceae bacterium]|jgi:thiol:disulfide interchange protein DsbD|nr:thioredoxin family protein [Caulobacteraceae bacterium]